LLVIAGNDDGSIQVWNQATKTLLFHLSGVHLNAIFALEIKNNILISTGGPFVALWDLSTGKLVEKYTCGDTPLFVTLIISDELLAVGGLGGLISIFDRKTRYLLPLASNLPLDDR
jgi:WD40 repeat protein